LYAATPYGVLLTTDGGATWSLANKGIESAWRSVTAAPNDPELVYASTGAGFYRSTDAGVTWDLLPGLATEGGTVVDPSDDSVVYSGVWKSVDGGVDWTRMYIPRPDRVDSFAIDPADPSVLFAGGYGGYRSGGLYESTNAGASWTQLFRGGASNLVMTATSPSTLYFTLSGKQGGVLYKSRDRGATWHEVESAPTGVGSIAPDPSHPSTVYVSASQGVFKTADSGHSWSPTGAGLESETVISLAVDPAHQAVVFVGTIDGIFESANGGGVWRNVTGNLEVTPSGVGVSVNSAGSVVYAAIPTGVWRAQIQI
jgi:photosystem II stability/assembly factor-like uncharacterized protein